MPDAFNKVNILQEAALREIFSRGAPILGNAYQPEIVFSQFTNLIATLQDLFRTSKKMGS